MHQEEKEQDVLRNSSIMHRYGCRRTKCTRDSKHREEELVAHATQCDSSLLPSQLHNARVLQGGDAFVRCYWFVAVGFVGDEVRPLSDHHPAVTTDVC